MAAVTCCGLVEHFEYELFRVVLIMSRNLIPQRKELIVLTCRICVVLIVVVNIEDSGHATRQSARNCPVDTRE